MTDQGDRSISFSKNHIISFEVNKKMAMLLVVIFLLVLIFTVLPEILPGISKKLVDLTVEESEDEHRLREEIQELKDELSTIPIVDQFPKYARTERKINKLKEDLHRICKSKTEVFLKFKLGFNIAFHAVQLLCFLVLIYRYRHDVILTMPEDWLTPFNKIISFPTGTPGAVSVTFWIITCKSSLPRLMRIFVNH